jgi:hypothetical protein
MEAQRPRESGAESPSAIDEWLISPLTLLGGTDTGLRFYWNGNRQFAQDVNAECLVRPSGSGTWTQLWSLQTEPDGTEFQYTERVVDISPWVGSQVEFAFRVSGTNGAEFVLDDIATGAFAPTGTPANDLCSGAIAISAGTHVFSGSTCYASDHLDAARLPGSCTADSLNGRDVFYWLSAAAGDTLQATVTGPWSPVLYLVNACGVGTGTCLNSAPKFQDGDITTAALQHVFAVSGVYFLVVDAVPGECGDFQLTTHIRSEVTGVESQESTLPHRSTLQARPNPSSGLIHFAGHRFLTGESPGILRIFDVSGRLVFARSISVPGGNFSEPWDGRSMSGGRLPSGVYVAKVEVGGEVLTTRFVLAQ